MLKRNPKKRPTRWRKKEQFRKLSKRGRIKLQYDNDWMTVKALRKFVNGFGAKDGYNLNDVISGKLSSAKKAKIRRLSEALKPELIAINSGNYVMKRYTNKERLRSAVEASQQESPMVKGQTGAIFYTRYPNDFKVRVLRNRAGINQFVFSDALYDEQRKLRFDSEEFLLALSRAVGYEVVSWVEVFAEAPEILADVIRVMLPDHTRFALLTGKYASTPVRARELSEFLASEAAKYADDDGEIDPDSLGFIFGIKGMD